MFDPRHRPIRATRPARHIAGGEDAGPRGFQPRIDKNAVIRAQVPTALALLTANVFLMYFLMFR